MLTGVGGRRTLSLMRARAVLLARPLAYTPFFAVARWCVSPYLFFVGSTKWQRIDGGYVLVRKSAVVSMLRLEIAGLMTARSAEAFTEKPRPDTRGDELNGMAGEHSHYRPKKSQKERRGRW
jgi:hypothetical protein